MKKIFTLILLINFNVFSQLDGPESCFYDQGRERWYVTNTDGRSIVSTTDFKSYSTLFISSLNSPKSMQMVNADLLTVADGNRLQVFSIPANLNVLTIDVPGSQDLNGLTQFGGSLFVTDFVGNSIYRVPIDGQYNAIELDSDNLDGPNGLVPFQNKVYFVTWGGQIGTIDPAKDFEVSIIKELNEFEFLDGIAVDKNGFFYISAWQDGNSNDGVIIRFNNTFEGEGTIIAEELGGPADIIYDEPNHRLIIPEMLNDKVQTLDLEEYIPEPTLSYPFDDRENIPTSFNFVWQKNTSENVTFDFELSKSESFSEMVITETGLQAQEYEVTDLEFETEYFWRVRSISAKVTSAWSEVWSFRTIAEKIDIAVPSLISPEDESINLPNEITLEWNSDTDEAANFEYQISLSKSFDDVLLGETLTDAFMKSDLSLDFGTTYYWRVRKIVGENLSDWSEVWSFTIEKEISVPNHSYPIDGAKEVERNLTFRWEIEDLDAISNFELILSSEPDFKTGDVFIFETDLNEYSVEENLMWGHTYYWKVIAYSISGEQLKESDLTSFTTKDFSSVNENGEELVFFPNPTKGKVFINSQKLINVEIYDVSGNLLIKSSANESKSIDINKLTKGVYYFKLILAKNKVKTQKIIIE